MSTMHCLVVCGAKVANNDVDAALFGHFMGLARTLQSLNTNISGTFLSHFPLSEHFALLAAQNMPIEDVKFGQDQMRKPL